ncbi:hypothetical protein [Xanthomonas sacchari]|uniref:Secreted protein n=1 Tax=Xanthomonas sacchari TaxID=56458 RepID=A0A2P5Z7F9_9XANT|nr:hypothetical protein [Xanthomonas sacchari]MDV0437419.1 hypothetical protein [Xanthomonas sacchari]PPU84298.1 hypothetical protein XsacCFBP4641_04335 [Xanthomonas sacchari]
MGILIYLTPAVALWAAVATAFAHGLFQRLGHAYRRDATAKETIARYQAALSQLKAQAAASAQELETLRQDHERLRATLEYEAAPAAAASATAAPANAPSPAATRAAPAPTPAAPPSTIALAQIDIADEVGTLLAHVARVARSIRRYSAYSRGHNGPEPASARYDLHWLSDCLHNLDQVGHALARNNMETLTAACTELLTMYEQYLRDGSGYNSRDTFQRLSTQVPLAEVTDAIRSIAAKASLARQAQAAHEQAAHAHERIADSRQADALSML